MLAAVSGLADGSADTGILAWDEFAVATTADITERLGLRHMSSRAARACRDKYLSRRLLHQAGLPAVRFRPAPTPDDAVRAALDIGLPVVVKPRSLGGSVGVTLVTDFGPASAAAALRAALDASVAAPPMWRSGSPVAAPGWSRSTGDWAVISFPTSDCSPPESICRGAG